MDYIWHRWAAPAALSLALGGTAQAQDKAQYWLFRPTPEAMMRDITTDRPDLTESPFTVDAGHIQVETNIFGYARSRPDPDGVFTRSFEYATTNVRIGLTNFAELNVVFAPHAVLKSHSPDPVLGVTRQSGSGGVDLRLKVNLWGNDSFEKPGATALAILPFVTIPTGWENGISPPGVEGGLIVPFSVKLTEKWGLGVSGGFHVVRDEIPEPGVRPGTHTEWLSSASFGYEWTEKLGTYYEVAGRFNTGNPRGDIGVLGTGFTYKITKNVQVDAGINFGVTRAADRVNPFLGLSARF